MKTKFGLGFLAAIFSVVYLVEFLPVSDASLIGKTGRESILEEYVNLPLYFIENKGQIDPRVRFYAQRSSQIIYFTDQGIVFDLVRRLTGAQKGARRTTEDPAYPPTGMAERLVFSLLFDNAQKGNSIEGIERQEAKINYLLGSNKTNWKTSIPTYRGIVYKEVYKGTDLRIKGDGKAIKYEFILNPGADPGDILLSYDGIGGLRTNGEGELIVATAFGELKETKPYIYQEIHGKRIVVDGRFKVPESVSPRPQGKRSYGFHVAAYDSSYPLVIDPTLEYSTYLGGIADDKAYGIAVDASGNAYVIGVTLSTDFPTENAYEGTLSGTSDAFVTKLSAPGSSLFYSTYLGGSDYDEGHGIAVDASGIYVVGWTVSDDFPTAGTPGPYQPSRAGSYDIFVTKLSAAGDALYYSTYLGGSAADYITQSEYGGKKIAVDAAGNAYVTGYTASSNFPTKDAYQGSKPGSTDAFVTKLTSTGSALGFSTYLGGVGIDYTCGIAVDSTGAYISGHTKSSNFPTQNAYQPVLNGTDYDAFVTKFSSTGALTYSTYLGGSLSDYGHDIATDASGNAYVTGYTISTDFPTQNPYQASRAGGNDVFITKLASTGSTLIYSTYLGGDSIDFGYGIAVDGSGNGTVTGITASSDFPTQNPYQGNISDGYDLFITSLSPTGNALEYSTYLGGVFDDYGYGIAVDSSGNAYVTGYTFSSDFPTQDPYQGNLAGGKDAFVLKYQAGNSIPTVSTTIPSSITSTTAESGGNVTSNGGAAVTERGVCWGTSVNPTTGDSYTSDGTGTGSFNSSITGLKQNTDYHVRAYATNSVGTAYGSDVAFTTTTNSVTMISMGSTQKKYCAPIVSNGALGTIKKIKMKLSPLQQVHVYWYMNDTPIYDYLLNVDSSPHFHDPFSQMPPPVINQFNWLGEHIAKIVVNDVSGNLLAFDEKSYEIVPCTEMYLSLDAPSTQCLGVVPDSIPATFYGNGSGSAEALWTDESERQMSVTIPEGSFNAVDYLPVPMHDIFNTAGFHFLRLDARLDPFSEIYVSDTVTFDIQPCMPAITSFTPTFGGAGTSVVITGSNFTGATGVKFGGTAASSFNVDASTQITATVGSGATGKVSVTTPNGTATSVDAFTFYQPPTVSSFTPTAGGTGTRVIITGTHFVGTEVQFGGIHAASFTVNSATQITATVGNGASGRVTVSTPGGTGISSEDFTFTPVASGTYHVDMQSGNDSNDGSDVGPWKTFHHAISQINGGGLGPYILHVGLGTYSVSNGEADTPIALTQSNVVLLGEIGSAPVLDGNDATDWTRGLEITGSNVTIKNLDVTGFCDEGEEGIRVSSAVGTQIGPSRIYGNDWGIRIDHSTGTRIKGCEIFQNSSHGIDITWSSEGRISENKIYNNPQYGIRVECSPEISRNEIYDNHWGILVEAASEDTASPLIVNNVIYRSLSGAMSYGIYMKSSDGSMLEPLVYHNTIDRCTDTGIAIDQDETATAEPRIKYNIITNSGLYGILNINGNPSIDHNDIWNNSGGNYSGCSAGPNDISLDPLYGSYELQSLSPCRDAIGPGVGDPVTLDYAGFRRPKGTGFDMGAYEYVGTITEDYILPGGEGLVTDYRIFTVPFFMTGSSMLSQMEAVVGTYDLSRWRGFAYRSPIYLEFNTPSFAGSSVIPGIGFWIISRLTDTIPFEGKVAPDGINYMLDLSPGWSLIALPWIDRNIDLGNMAVTDGLNTYSFMGEANPLTQRCVWDYTGSGPYSGYEKRNLPTYPLQCGTGYFIKVLATTHIKLIIPPENVAIPPVIIMDSGGRSTQGDEEQPPPTPGEAYGPFLDIKVNGREGPLLVNAGDSVSVSVTLDPGAWMGQSGDWWVTAHTPADPPDDWYTYVYPTGWVPGINLTVRTPLFAFSGFEVLNTRLPVGEYTFYFAIDDPDGLPTGPWWGHDSVVVNVD